MDFKQRVRISLCTCGLCIGLAVTVETAHAMYSNECGVRRDVIVCGTAEAIMPLHAPHSTDISTPAFEQRVAVAALGADLRVSVRDSVSVKG